MHLSVLQLLAISSVCLLDLVCIYFVLFKAIVLEMLRFQGIWLCEHRDAPTARRVVVTLNGI